MDNYSILPDHIPEYITSIPDDKKRHFSSIYFMLDYSKNAYDTQTMCRNALMIFNYIFENNLLSFFGNTRFINVIHEKLKEFEYKDIDGPYNPKLWVPVVMRKLFPPDDVFIVEE